MKKFTLEFSTFNNLFDVLFLYKKRIEELAVKHKEILDRHNVEYIPLGTTGFCIDVIQPNYKNAIEDLKEINRQHLKIMEEFNINIIENE